MRFKMVGDELWNISKYVDPEDKVYKKSYVGDLKAEPIW